VFIPCECCGSIFFRLFTNMAKSTTDITKMDQKSLQLFSANSQ